MKLHYSILLGILLITSCSRIDMSDIKQKTNYALGRSIGEKEAAHRSDIDTDVISDAINDFFLKKDNRSSSEDKRSYDLGWNCGKLLTAYSMEYHKSAFILGFEEGLEKDENRLTPKEMETIIAGIKEKARESQSTMSGQFFSSIKEDKSVITTPSGLKYRIIAQGSGQRPKPNDTVRVHYKGQFTNGTEFDSTYKLGMPLDIPLNKVIPGWQEGLQLMKEGATYSFIIPSKLAYGDKGRGMIPGKATLIFEIKLIKIIR